MLVVMGPVMGVPVNLLYSAAFGPGFLLAGCYIAYTLVRSFVIEAWPADDTGRAQARLRSDDYREGGRARGGIGPRLVWWR